MLVGGNQSQEAKALCTVCGGELKEDGECSACGALHEVKDGKVQVKASAPESSPKEAFISEVSKIPGMGPAKTELLWDRGYHDVAAVSQASMEDLAAVDGFGEKLARKLYAYFHPEAASETGAPEEVLSEWLKGEGEDFEAWLGGEPRGVPVSKVKEEVQEAEAESEVEGEKVEAEGAPVEPPPAAVEAPSPEDSADALRRWLMGDEEALETWLSQPVAVSEERMMPSTEPEEGEADIEKLKAELTELKRAIKAELANVKEGRFDPIRYLEEIAKLSRQLQQEVKMRKELESEIDHMKKASVAVIKYVKSQKSKEEGPEAKRRLAEERETRRKLEVELGRLKSLLEKAQTELKKGLKELPEGPRALREAEIGLAEKEAELQAKEEELKLMEEELKAQEGRVADPELEQRLQAELAEKEREFLDKEAEMKKRIIELEGDVERLKIEAKLRAEAMELTSKPGKEINKELAEKAKTLQLKERDLLLREEEVKKLREELTFKEDELRRVKEPLAYKEEELLRREEDLIYREKLLEAEKRQVEEAKAQAGSVEEMALKERLEALKGEISKKEEEVRAKEKYLNAKMEELRMREKGLIEEEIEARDEERKLELRQEKVKTGTPRLDDLLLGGVPFGSNISVYGPPFIGKEVIVNGFVAEGLKKGIPAILVITDKTPDDVREEMQYVLPGYEEYERLGLVKYVDAYSKGMGPVEEDPNVIYIDDPTDYESILRTVDELSKEYKAEHPYYRLAFRSISTLIAYLDPATTFRFLQPFAGRRKRDKAISMYVIEKGMHGEQEIQLLGSVMDGMIEFKVEQLKTFLSVKGISDVQSRAWIQYMYSKQGVSIGSFSLDHIK
ncbi:MAG: ATPase domain-containing protein [Thermoplasmata archaeon]